MTYFMMNASFSEMNSVVVASVHGLVEKYYLLNETGCSREVLPLNINYLSQDAVSVLLVILFFL